MSGVKANVFQVYMACVVIPCRSPLKVWDYRICNLYRSDAFLTLSQLCQSTDRSSIGSPPVLHAQYGTPWGWDLTMWKSHIGRISRSGAGVLSCRLDECLIGPENHFLCIIVIFRRRLEQRASNNSVDALM